MSGDHVDPAASTELVPRIVRSVAYIVGTLAAGVSTALTTDAPLAARILSATAAACLLLAVGYRPTR